MGVINNTNNDHVRYYFYSDNLDTVYIDEPIGANDDGYEYLRHDDYHGIFNVISNNLEFYGNARQIIKDTFDTYGVNAKLILGKDILVQDKTQVNTMIWQNEYETYLNFKTYILKENTAVCRFSTNNIADVLEVSESIDIEIERGDTLSGVKIQPIATNLVTLAQKEISKTDQSKLSSVVNADLFPGSFDGISLEYTTPLSELISRVHEDFSEVSVSGANTLTANNMFYTMSDVTPSATITLKILLEAEITIDVTDWDVNAFVSLKQYHWDGSSYVSIGEYSIFDITGSNVKNIINKSLDITLSYQDSLAMVIASNQQGKINKFNITVLENSSYITTNPNNKFVFVNDLLKQLTLINTNKDIFKSNFYTIGNGYLRGFTSGLWIRNFVKGSKGYRSPKISFKDLISSLDAVDCIGLGIQKDGVKTQLRVEDRKYFYQDVITIDLPFQVNEVEREVYTDGYYNELEFGYQNSGGYEKELGLDEPNSITKFTTAIKTIKNNYQRVSKINADANGKELTRRKPQDKFPLDDTKGDDYNWFLDIKDRINEITPYTEKTWVDRFDEVPTGVFSPETYTGLWFSPANNMLRHSWYFSQGLEKNLFDYTKYASSTGNSQLSTKLNGIIHKENADYLNYYFDVPRILPTLIKFKAIITNDVRLAINGYTNIGGEEVPNVYGLVNFINEYKETEQGYIKFIKLNTNEFELLSYNSRPRRTVENLDTALNGVEMFGGTLLELSIIDANINTAPIIGELYEPDPYFDENQLSMFLQYSPATDTNLVGYNIYYKQSSAPNYTLYGSTTDTQILLTGLLAYTYYDFYITAYDSGTPSLESLPSNVKTARTLANTQPTTSVLSSGTPTNTTIPLNWTASYHVSGLLGYRIFYKLSSDSVWSFIFIDPSLNTHTLTGLTPSTSYDFKILSQALENIDSTILSEYSNIVTVSTTANNETWYTYHRSGENTTSNLACSDTPDVYTINSLDAELQIGSTIYTKPNVSFPLNGHNKWFLINFISYRINTIGQIIDISMCVI